MVDDTKRNESESEPDEIAPVVVRRSVGSEAELDITPMIDVTFLLLIFFLVCSTASQDASPDLPPAQYGKGVSERGAVVFSVASAGADGETQVYLGGLNGQALSRDPQILESEIVAAVEEGVQSGNTTVLVKASKEIKYREIERVGAAIGLVEGINLNMAVMEMK